MIPLIEDQDALSGLDTWSVWIRAVSNALLIFFYSLLFNPFVSNLFFRSKFRLVRLLFCTPIASAACLCVCAMILGDGVWARCTVRFGVPDCTCTGASELSAGRRRKVSDASCPVQVNRSRMTCSALPVPVRRLPALCDSARSRTWLLKLVVETAGDMARQRGSHEQAVATGSRPRLTIVRQYRDGSRYRFETAPDDSSAIPGRQSIQVRDRV